MPTLKRPDGATIHWEQRGDGPALYVAHNLMSSTPSTFDALLTDLAGDHRVVTWDPRGSGRSSRHRPYDMETDAGDLAALVEQVGDRGMTVSFGFSPAPLMLADTRPELVAAVVLVGAPPQLGPPAGGDAESLLHSDAVAAAILQMARTDPRALQRTMITMGNPQLSEAEVRARLEAQLAYCPLAAWVERAESYLSYDASRTCAALGARLWILHWQSPLTPGRPVKRVRAMVPEAHIIEAEDGPISRPDLTAAAVRQATASLPAS